MAECTMKVVGRRQNRIKKSLEFVIFCTKSDTSWYAHATIEDIFTSFKSASKSLCLLPAFSISHLDSYEISYLDHIQEEITMFLYSLRFREDILCHPIIQELLSIPSFTYPIEFHSNLKVSDVYTLTTIQIIPEVKSFIVGGEYISMFKGIGKLWSLIETQSLGTIMLLGIDDILFKIEKLELHNQVKCSLWHAKTFECFFGLGSGALLVVKCKMKLAANSKGIFNSDKLSVASQNMFPLHSSAILSIVSLDDLIITISSDSILKICVYENSIMEAVGGGSLKQRLNTDKLRCLQVDPLTKKLFLGTEQGKVLVYIVENKVPKFLYTVCCESCVRDIESMWGVVYIAAGACVIAFADSKELEMLARFNPNQEGLEVTCLKYIKNKDRIFVGYSNGVMIVWHTVVFQLLIAVKLFEERIIRIEVDEDNGVLVVANSYSEIKVFRI